MIHGYIWLKYSNLHAGSFSRSAVNYQAGVKTPVANIVMSLMVMVVLLALTGLFHDTPNAILSSIIINAVISLVDFSAMYKIWKLDFGDFICMLGALLGVIFKSVEIGLLVAVGANGSRLTFLSGY
jgi:high affinity sulfate transporter 1